MSIEDYAEHLGRLADRFENALHARKLPIPDRLHLQATEELMRDARDELASIVREVTGENPWETNPFDG